MLLSLLPGEDLLYPLSKGFHHVEENRVALGFGFLHRVDRGSHAHEFTISAAGAESRLGHLSRPA